MSSFIITIIPHLQQLKSLLTIKSYLGSLLRSFFIFSQSLTRAFSFVLRTLFLSQIA